MNSLRYPQIFALMAAGGIKLPPIKQRVLPRLLTADEQAIIDEARARRTRNKLTSHRKKS